MRFKYCLIILVLEFLISTKCLNLNKIAFALFGIISKLICCFQIKLLSIYQLLSVFITRYFQRACWVQSFLFKFSVKEALACYLGDLDKINSVLLKLRKFYLCLVNFLDFSNLDILFYSFSSINCYDVKDLYHLQLSCVELQDGHHHNQTLTFKKITLSALIKDL